MTAILYAEDIATPTSDAPILTNGYRNNRTIWMLPSLMGHIPLKVHVSLRNMARPMNTPLLPLEKQCKEVGTAYEEMTALAMEHPECARYPFIWTYEEDNIQPPDVLLKLLDAIWTCPDCRKPMPSVAIGDAAGDPVEPWVCEEGHRGFDAVGALYFTKSNPRIAMAYGDPTSPDLEMRPRDVREAMKDKAVIEVNGVAMGSTLYRRALFSKVSRPWFKTLSTATQDLYFCRKAKEEAQARFGVHCGVVSGHLDPKTGVIF